MNQHQPLDLAELRRRCPHSDAITRTLHLAETVREQEIEEGIKARRNSLVDQYVEQALDAARGALDYDAPTKHWPCVFLPTNDFGIAMEIQAKLAALNCSVTIKKDHTGNCQCLSYGPEFSCCIRLMINDYWSY
jgi:hypothetical protein